MTCIFCEIAAGRVPSDKVYQDEQVIAFRDISPQAPKHILIMPKAHIPSLNDLKTSHEKLIAHLILVAVDLAKKEGIADKGYRLAVNCGPDGNQIVPHLHFHLVGGRKLDGMLG